MEAGMQMAAKNSPLISPDPKHLAELWHKEKSETGDKIVHRLIPEANYLDANYRNCISNKLLKLRTPP